jgi:hypothetical protein
VSGAILEVSYLAIFSVAIEAFFFYLLVKKISPLKALLMSCVGNIVSFFIGTLVTAVAMIGWHAIFDRFLDGTFNTTNFVATYIIMFLGTCFIELLTIKWLFRYEFKQLYIPVLVGNLVTYLLAAVMHWEEVIMVLNIK